MLEGRLGFYNQNTAAQPLAETLEVNNRARSRHAEGRTEANDGPEPRFVGVIVGERNEGV